MKENFQPGDIVRCVEGYCQEIIMNCKYTITRSSSDGISVSIKEQPLFSYGSWRFEFAE